MAMTITNPSEKPKPFLISRTVNAPRDLVWKVWTENEHLKQWFGPKGVPIRECTLDLRVGGMFHYVMITPNGSEMWGRWVFREIVPPEHLAWVSSFSNQQGEVAPAPFEGSWPAEILTSLTLEEADGKTKVTISSEAINATEEEVAFFTSMYGSMNQGWSGTYELLEEYLAAIQK